MGWDISGCAGRNRNRKKSRAAPAQSRLCLQSLRKHLHLRKNLHLFFICCQVAQRQQKTPPRWYEYPESALNQINKSIMIKLRGWIWNRQMTFLRDAGGECSNMKVVESTHKSLNNMKALMRQFNNFHILSDFLRTSSILLSCTCLLVLRPLNRCFLAQWYGKS